MIGAISSARPRCSPRVATPREQSPDRVELGGGDPAGEALYQRFLKQSIAEGSNADHLSFLDRGIDSSWLKEHIPAYPSRLHTLKPAAGAGDAYPATGVLPRVEKGLDFLDPSINEACVVVGGWQDGQLRSRWVGRNALEPAQMWSATKTFPMTRVAVKASGAKLENCTLTGGLPLTRAFDAIVSYRDGGSASNRHARTLKHFDTPAGLESWLHRSTGNPTSTFRGGYGEPASIARPTLKEGDKTVLTASGFEHKGENLVSAYDLCRMLSNTAWHPHLRPESRLPGLQQAGADTLARALGTDSARFVDVSLEALGLQDRIENPVVLSKLGFGLSDSRKRWESVYSAFVSFTDKQTGETHQLAMALRGHHEPSGPRPAVELDARMAASVAQIIQQVVDGKL